MSDCRNGKQRWATVCWPNTSSTGYRRPAIDAISMPQHQTAKPTTDPESIIHRFRYTAVTIAIFLFWAKVPEHFFLFCFNFHVKFHCKFALASEKLFANVVWIPDRRTSSHRDWVRPCWAGAFFDNSPSTFPEPVHHRQKSPATKGGRRRADLSEHLAARG